MRGSSYPRNVQPGQYIGDDGFCLSGQICGIEGAPQGERTKDDDDVFEGRTDADDARLRNHAPPKQLLITRLRASRRSLSPSLVDVRGGHARN
ncbi:hypothetical protein TcasGA2_TC034473 [Tribolium castaneum]|uniref:Uncharacterized protein n=1 Tax=Tribolium castaneum TaxID=7070 RepID=A0A139WBX3_TRICA|nr:hypothetical protein TcasGA2_TC034473 [Tribolium castaneum]